MTAGGPLARPRLRTYGWGTAVLLVAAVVLSGCSSAVGSSDGAKSTTSTTVPLVTKKGGTVTIGIEQATTGCNPNTAAGDTWANQLVLSPVLPRAFVVEPSGRPVLDQAVVQQAELVSTSPETIDYTLNPKAVWSDGAPISAQDFIYAWQQQRGVDPSVASDVATTLGYRDIASVKGSNGGLAVQVVFKTPFSDWQMLFDPLMPSHVMEQVGWDPACTSVDPAVDLSGGPFEIASVKAGEVVLDRNPRWWGQPANLDHLVIRTASGPGQLARWLANGTAQVVEPTGFNAGFLQVVGATSRAASQLELGTEMLQLQFAMTGTATRLRSVREAVADAVNRTSLVKTAAAWADASIAPAASFVYAQGQNGYPDLPSGVSAAPHDQPDAAGLATLLKSAGYHLSALHTWQSAPGKDLVLRMVVDSQDSFAVQSAQIITAELRRAGIVVLSSVAASATSAGEDLAAGRADLAVLPVETGAYPAVANALYTLSLGAPGDNGSQDWPRLDDSGIEKSLASATQELNPDTAGPFYQQADQRLWQILPALPLFTEPAVLAWSSSLKSVGLNPYNAGLLWYGQTWAIQVPASTTTTTGASSTSSSTTSSPSG